MTDFLESLKNGDKIFLTPGGLGTTLRFKTNFPLRLSAGFEVLLTPEWQAVYDRVMTPYVDIANRHALPLLLNTETWRASAAWFDLLGTPKDERRRVHALAADVARALTARVAGGGVVLGEVGSHADGYIADTGATLASCRDYHGAQMRALHAAGVLAATAMTITNSTEAAGVALASHAVGLPCVVSFTTETDARLPSGEPLGAAIERADALAGTARPAHYMLNCVHPRHVHGVLAAAVAAGETWPHRLCGMRANASTKSHAELDECDAIDEGEPAAWARELLALRDVLPTLLVLGGCCGTGPRHIEELANLISSTRASA